MKYEIIKKKYQDILEKLNATKNILSETEDGYRYIAFISIFHSKDVWFFANELIAQEEINHFNGENGICYILTTNPKFNTSEGIKKINISEEEYDMLMTKYNNKRGRWNLDMWNVFSKWKEDRA